nr:bldA-regulated nucleotide binding protein [uncultured Mediterranean phage uvMED]
MGGFGGGNSTGSGGGVGPAGRKSDGSYGSKKDASRAGRRNEGRKAAKQVLDFIKGGGVTGAIVRGITKSAKKSKAKKQANVEVGLGADRMSNYTVNQGGTRETGGNNNQGIELAKTASTEPVTKRVQQAAVDAAPTGPTNVEMPTEESEAERLLKIKRKGRRATILNVPDDELTLSKKVLLG